MKRDTTGRILAGAGAGIVNGLFGAGGGMVLVPLLRRFTTIREDALFPSSIGIILPICLVSLGFSAMTSPLPLKEALPYLTGSAVGGYLAGKTGHRIPTLWLHRILGVLILWGGVRYIW